MAEKRRAIKKTSNAEKFDHPKVEKILYGLKEETGGKFPGVTSFPRTISDCTEQDRHLRSFLRQWTPSPKDESNMEYFVADALKIISSKTIPNFLNALAVGSHKSRTRLKLRKTADVIVLLDIIPNLTHLELIGSAFENNKNVTFKRPFGIIVRQDDMDVRILLTSSLVLDMKDKMDEVSYEMLKRGLDAVRHEVWYSRNYNSLTSDCVRICKALVYNQVLKCMESDETDKNRDELNDAMAYFLEDFGTFNWIVVCHFAISNLEADSICLCKAISSVFESLSSGCLLSSKETNIRIKNPCSSKNIGDELTFQSRDLITIFAQNSLRSFSQKQFHHLFPLDINGDNEKKKQEELERMTSKNVQFSALWPVF